MLSCSAQDLEGRWKAKKVTMAGLGQTDSLTIDLTNADQLKKEMLASLLSEPQEEGYKIDTSEMKTDIDQTVSAYQKNHLWLNKNKTFEMVSNGLLLENSIPGWHFGDSLTGTWVRTDKLLTLFIGTENQGYQWKFKILDLSSKMLKVQQISQGVRQIVETLEGPKNVIEFVRQ